MMTSAASQIDKEIMAYTVELALKGKRCGYRSQRAACSIVKNGKIIASSWIGKTLRKGLIEDLLDELGGDFTGVCVYLSQELNTEEANQPPSYAKLLVKANVDRVVVGAKAFNPKIENKAIQYMRDGGLVVEVGVLEKEVENLNKGLLKRYKDNEPWVCGCYCIGLDKSDQEMNAESIVLQSSLERTRSNYDAIVIVLPAPDGYFFEKEVNSPFSGNESKRKLVVVDLGDQVSNIEKYINHNLYEVIIYSVKEMLLSESLGKSPGVELLLLPVVGKEVDWVELIRDLFERGLNEIFIEMDFDRHKELVNSNLLDEFCVFVSPYIGDKERKFSAMVCETVCDGWIKINSRF